MSAFRMFKARGQPGCWYGYVDIPGVGTFKIDARHVGERQSKHFEGTVKRHLKADQQTLPLAGSEDGARSRLRPPSRQSVPPLQPAAGPSSAVDPDFDDELPEVL